MSSDPVARLSVFAAGSLAAWMFAASSFSQESWDGPLLPVQNGKVILDLECTRQQQLRWEEELAPYTYGLRAGDTVVVLSEEEPVEATLGRVSCLVGACSGEYASIELQWPNSVAEPFAVVERSFLGEVKPSRPVTVDTAVGPDCSEMFSRISNEYSPEIEEERTCELLRLNEQSFLQLARNWFMQENGWPVAETRARVLSREGESVRVGASRQMDYDTSPLTPRLLLAGTDGTERLLWSKSAVSVAHRR